MTDFSHFLAAQTNPTAGFDTALTELRAGQKTGHWIWYVFPQLAGLGRSEVAERFAIADFDDARAYARDPTLGPRLLQAFKLVREQLVAQVPLMTLMGSDIDARKLVSSATLFLKTGEALAHEPAMRAYGIDLAHTCEAVLDLAQKANIWRCGHTLQTLSLCGACGLVYAPDPPTGSSIAPTSYGRCQTCQEQLIEMASLFPLVYADRDRMGLPEYIDQVRTYIDGELVTWPEWVARHEAGGQG